MVERKERWRLPLGSVAPGIRLASETLQASVDGLRVELTLSTLATGIGAATHEEGPVYHPLPLTRRQKVQDLRGVNERLRDARVELHTRVLAELIERLPAERLAVRPVRGHGVPGVAGVDSFLAMAGLFLAAAQAPHALLRPGDLPDVYLLSWSLAAGILAAHSLRRSELNEVGPLRRSADVDPLTALHNQAFFRRAAARRITQARESGLPLSLAMLDIDDFKNYNDAFGHEAGNAVLRILAGVLRRSVRADDLVARYGGEEFVVLLGGRPGDVEEAVERIRLQVEDRCSPRGGSSVRRQVTVSAGVAALTEDVQTLEELIEAAEEAMYRAKRAGKNRVAVAAEEAA